MKRITLFLLLGIILIGLIYAVYPIGEGPAYEEPVYYDEVPSLSSLPTEQFIKNHLMVGDGTIRTNFAAKESESGEQRLSESIGLWLEYLAHKKDSGEFEKAAQVMRENFLLSENLIAWEIRNGEQATTNALIDDLRIIEALFREGERTGNSRLIQWAEEISEALLQYNREQDYFIDFYDTRYQYSSPQLTLSYLNPIAFQYMVAYDLLTEDKLNELHIFMNSIPVDHGFYPKTYDTAEQIFIYDETINLIDQLYTVLHLERAGIETGKFYQWLRDTYYQEGRLYGRYDRKTKEPAVNYEAAAVYALTILYCIERGDANFAVDVYKRMTMMRVQDQAHPYYGGYVELGNNDTHSFDNLLPLIAERKLQIEQVINEHQ